jgi:hypothetical protein
MTKFKGILRNTMLSMEVGYNGLLLVIFSLLFFSCKQKHPPDEYYYFTEADKKYIPYLNGDTSLFYNQADTTKTFSFTLPPASDIKEYSTAGGDGYATYIIYDDYFQILNYNITGGIIGVNTDYSAIELRFSKCWDCKNINVNISFGNMFRYLTIPNSVNPVSLSIGNKTYNNVYIIPSFYSNNSQYYYVSKIYYDVYKGIVKFEKFNGEVWLLKN